MIDLNIFSLLTLFESEDRICEQPVSSLSDVCTSYPFLVFKIYFANNNNYWYHIFLVFRKKVFSSYIHNHILIDATVV